MAKPMKDAVRIPIYDLFARAKQASEVGNYAETERRCDEAWARIPEPRFGWDVTYMCLSGMVDFLRAAGRYDKVITLVEDYLSSEYCLDYEVGPYFWLGTLHYEKGDLGKAYSYLERANKMSRGRCFVEEDPKYKQFFKTYKTTGLH